MDRIVMLVTRDGKEQSIHELAAGTHTLGRHPDCGVFLDDALVSPKHARVQIDHDGVFIEDLGTFSGLRIDGEHVYGAQLIPGQLLSIGPFEIAVERSPQTEPATVSGQRPTSGEELPHASGSASGGASAEARAGFDTILDLPRAEILAARQFSDDPVTEDELSDLKTIRELPCIFLSAAEESDHRSAGDDSDQYADTAVTQPMPRPEAPPPRKVTDLNLQHAWYRAVRQRAWRSMAIVPVGEEISTLEIARGFTELASRDPTVRAAFIDASTQRCVSTSGAIGGPIERLWTKVVEEERAPLDELPFSTMSLASLSATDAQRVLSSAPRFIELLSADDPAAYSMLIFSTDCPIAHPKALTLCRAVERIVLCVALGESLLQETQRLVKLLGRERIVGIIATRA